MTGSGKADFFLRAVVLNLTGIILLDIMGLIVKHLSGSYSATELTVYRNVFGMVPSLALLWFSTSWQAAGRRVRIRQWPLACSRGVFVTLAQCLFYLSLARMEFATATTISFSMALFITAFSMPLLGERVGWFRWSAVITGFVGVVMVMEPGPDGVGLTALLPLGAAMLYALTSVTARMIDDDVPTPLMNLYANVAAVCGSVVLTLSFGNFTPIATATDLMWIVTMGTLGGCGVLCLIFSFRMTEPSNLAPFHYFGIPFSFFLGWMFFDEAPFGRLFPGVLLILAGGLLIVWRERRLRSAAN